MKLTKKSVVKNSNDDTVPDYKLKDVMHFPQQNGNLICTRRIQIDLTYKVKDADKNNYLENFNTLQLSDIQTFGHLLTKSRNITVENEDDSSSSSVTMEQSLPEIIDLVSDKETIDENNTYSQSTGNGKTYLFL